MFLQPFLAYQATRTWTITLQSETTANWEVDEDRWTVPINVQFSKLSSFGAFPASYQLGFGGFVGASGDRAVMEGPRRHRHSAAASPVGQAAQ